MFVVFVVVVVVVVDSVLSRACTAEDARMLIRSRATPKATPKTAPKVTMAQEVLLYSGVVMRLTAATPMERDKKQNDADDADILSVDAAASLDDKAGVA